jgi:hypothetical protein
MVDVINIWLNQKLQELLTLCGVGSSGPEPIKKDIANITNYSELIAVCLIPS